MSHSNSFAQGAAAIIRENGYPAIGSTRGIWTSIDRLPDVSGKQVIILSRDLIDVITNPEGVGMGWYDPSSRSFIVPTWERGKTDLTNTKVLISRVTHFILAEGL